MKKGQIEHTFIFIFALIVAALILAWGTKTIFDLKRDAEMAQIASSIEDIKEVAVTYYNLEAGSEQQLKLKFPEKIRCVCFVDRTTAISLTDSQKADVNKDCDSEKNRLGDIISSSGNHNIFLAPSDLNYPVKKFSSIKELKPATSPLCFNTKPTLAAKITSQGNAVIIGRA